MSVGGTVGKVGAYVELLDLPPVSLVLVAAAGFTTFAAGGAPPPGLPLFLLSVLLTQFAIALHNHYCDRDLDAVARPRRALPRGLLPARLVAAAAWGLLALGLALALALGPQVAGLVALGTGAAFVYNAWLKRTAWSWLPYWVALPTLAVCSFAVAGRGHVVLWTAYVVGLPLVLAIHLVDELSDVETDTAAGVRGLAHRLGPRRTRYAAWGALAAAQGLALWLWPQGGAPSPLFYLSPALLLVAIVLGARRVRRGHWLAAMGSSLALALAWVGDLAAGLR